MNNVSSFLNRAYCAKWLSPAAAWFVLSGCSQQTVTVQLHPLQQSGDVTYVCRVAPGAGQTGVGVPLSECNVGSIARGERDLFALVTQTSTGEVAVINVPLDQQLPASGEGVVDVDLNTPGYGFLPIGAQPGDIVTTPGGFASFVGVGEAGKPGIFALETMRLSGPGAGQPAFDITSWHSCSLPAAPGSIAVVVEPPAADGTVYSSCQHDTVESKDGLATEGGPLGRRKLIVSLPDLGALAVVDAQSLLEDAPGTFQPCNLEGALFPLQSTLPAQLTPQVLPDDLKNPDDPTCKPYAPPQPPADGTPLHATPAGFALADDDTLYVGDATAPLIHALNVRNPCALSEGTPLYPRSLDIPSRTVTTSRLAVSPLTPSAKRFVYAIDQFDWPTASIMAFDVSPGSTDRTPLVRPRSSLILTEAPDRIQVPVLAAPKDISFLLRDRPVVDGSTGNVVVGEACDPEPDPDKATVGASYRTSADYSTGARAVELRGVFASVLLSNGQLAFVDVEDFDAPCRRPVTANPDEVEDFRGCRNDPSANEYKSADGTRTVSDEVSCNMVEPHRLRSSNLGITSSTLGIRAPSLRSLPQFRPPDNALQAPQTDRPKLLGVDFDYGETGRPPDPAQVFVGSSLHVRTVEGDKPTADDLVIDPTQADRQSVVLPFNEPRAYPSINDLSLTFEGPIAGGLNSGFLKAPTAMPGLLPGALLLRDSGAVYCNLGVNDATLMADVGRERGVPDALLADFAAAHADYVSIIADFPEEDSQYWNRDRTRASCEALFGKFDDKVLKDTRDFTIVDAQQQLLSLKPRANLDQAATDARVEAALKCFPEGTAYVIRASDQWVLRGSVTGFRHNVVARWQKDGVADYLECVRDCNPSKKYFDSRVFEIRNPGAPDADYCVANNPTGLQLDSSKADYDKEARKCVHSTPTERFAVYRGGAPSKRDMIFTWQTVGGFSTLRVDLGAVSAGVSPQNQVPLPAFNWLTVVDASSLGLALVSLDTLSPLTPTIY